MASLTDEPLLEVRRFEVELRAQAVGERDALVARERVLDRDVGGLALIERILVRAGRHRLVDEDLEVDLLVARGRVERVDELGPAPAGRISSCTREPGMVDTAGPRPMPTALIAGIDIKACARRPSSFRSHCT